MYHSSNPQEKVSPERRFRSYFDCAPSFAAPIPEVYIAEISKQVERIMDSVKLLEKTKKQLRSVLISEKGGVAADRLERDYRDLVITN